MKSKDEDEKSIDSILKYTKTVVSSSVNFYSYFHKNDDSLFEKQIKILTEPSNSEILMETKLNNKKSKLIKKKKIPFPLKNIRNLTIKSKLIPPLCPLYNNKNELIPSIVFSSKIERNNILNKTSYFSKTLGSIPLNLKKSNSLNFIKENNEFEDFQKDFFGGNNYSNLKYDEFEIFHNNKKKYEKTIKEKIKYFKKENNENQTVLLEKNLLYGNKEKKKVILSLNSIIIKFEDLSQKNKIKEIKFPFSLLPLFYYKGFDSFQKLLSQIIKIDVDFDKISIDDNSIYIALNYLKDFENEEKNFSFKNTPQKKIINKQNEKVEYFYVASPKKKKQQILIQSKKSKNNYLKYNNFYFFWTTIKKTFKVSISLPIIHLNFPQNNILIKQYIDYELLFYLYGLNFLFWDFYIIRYLLGFKKLRDFLKDLHPFNNIYNKHFFLVEPKEKNYSFSEEFVYVIYTDDNNHNKMIKFKSFSLIIDYMDFNSMIDKQYIVDFTFLHLKKLFQISMYSEKLLFLSRFLEINQNNNTVNFNFKYFNEFNIKEWMENIEKYNEKKINNKKDFLSNEFCLSEKKRLRVEFKKSLLTLIPIKKSKETPNHYFFEKNIEDDLIKCIVNQDFKNLFLIINHAIEIMNAPISFFPHSHSSSPFKFKKSESSKKNLEKIIILNLIKVKISFY